MPDDPEDLRRRSQELAGELLRAMQRPGSDPERAAYDARKEAEDRSALEDYYRRTGQAVDRTPRARTATEMRFAASLLPCGSCGSMEPAKLDLVGSGESWSLQGTCPACGKTRAYGWLTEGHPNAGACPPRQLADARPSQIIRPGQFMAELDRLGPLVEPTPEALEPVAWRASLAAIDRSITCLYELLKFVPPGRKSIPDTILTAEERLDRRERYSQAWLSSELERLLALRRRYEEDAKRIWALEAEAQGPVTPPRGALDRDSLRAHEAWVRAGCRGPGRLDVVGWNARGQGFAGAQLSGARLEQVNLDRARLEAARMDGCELRQVSAVEANAESIQLRRSSITGGSFRRSALALSVFEEAVIEETSFEESHLDRSTWTGAVVKGACFDRVTFWNAWLGGARFTGCTFRMADFGPKKEGLPPATTDAVFEDCDLRDTSWEGRDLTGAVFIRCKMGGISGRPNSVERAVIESPDLSPEGDGSAVAGAQDVVDLWTRGGP